MIRLFMFAAGLLALDTVTALNFFGSSFIKNEITIVHGNITGISNFAASYFAPFAPENAEEKPFELIEEHEDLVQDKHGSIVSLRKRGDDCQKYHKVVRGDNCYTLSLKYNIDMSSIYEWNEHINDKCTNLYPGKSYCVRKDSETTLETTCTETYYVKDSDTCITVIKQHGITLDQFYDMNPSVNVGACDNLLTGGTYCIREERKQVIRTKIVQKAAKAKPYRRRTTTTKKKSATKKTTTTKKKSTTKKTSTTKKKTTNKFTTKKNTSKKPTSKKSTAKKTTTKKTTAIKMATTIKKATTTTKKTIATKKPATTKTTTSQSPEATSSSDRRKLLQKNSALTYYWIAHPEDYDDSGKSVTIKTCDGKTLGSIPEKYADALVMEGTGIVGDKIINLGGCSCTNYKCFMEVDKKEDPFGLTSFGSPLRPFITIAANDIKRNTKIFVPDLAGWEIPGTSKKHNGCLLVDDRSWSFNSNHIDFYVYREKNYRTLNGENKVSKVDIYEGGDCNLLNYSS